MMVVQSSKAKAMAREMAVVEPQVVAQEARKEVAAVRGVAEENSSNNITQPLHPWVAEAGAEARGGGTDTTTGTTLTQGLGVGTREDTDSK